MIPKVASSCDLELCILGENHRRRKIQGGQNAALWTRQSPPSTVSSPVMFRAAAEAAKKKRFSGQYTTAEVGHAASELQRGQRAMWGPCVEVGGTAANRRTGTVPIAILSLALSAIGLPPAVQFHYLEWFYLKSH
ncbi:WW domain-containing oxidoreductase [Fusarium oxysporum f. sp. albedinis]|nr:WW domain-containing oxidoreductase [Fusarium oxysporum f. sp. albedinis]